jgi:leucyl aminopeptidase
MIDYSALLQPDQGQAARDIHIIQAHGFDDWYAGLPAPARSLIDAQQFKGKSGEVIILPSESTGDWSIIMGAVDPASIWDLASVAARVPAGTYRLAEGMPGQSPLGWLLAHYRFDAYLPKSEPVPLRVLLTRDPAAIPEMVRLAEATALVRDLVNTPAADMGPDRLEAAVEVLAKAHKLSPIVTKGDALEAGFPMVYAVGKAAERAHAPRVIELEWGNPKHPRIAVIGKGITFDSGGLDIKPAGAMRAMKKDMGGAAHALALAKLIIEGNLPVRLNLIISAAENAIAGNAFRPGDILNSRKGLTVEIENTDAEGRLVLADAITRACEDKPELIIDFATLTGAARVALGPDLPAMFCNNHDIANRLSEYSVAVHDPVWRLPLWTAYNDMFKSDVADMMNSSEGGMAGAITAALFLKKFVPDDVDWVHLDTFAWRGSTKAGRPKGGEALGLRAVHAMLKARYSA